MKTFCEFLSDITLLSRLRLIETYFSFDPAQYNRLFDDELGKLSVSSPEHRAAIERMRGFNWVGYIAKSVRNAGYRDQREVQERTHDIVVKMLVGGLFRDFDELKSGQLDLRFKRSVANGILNMIEKDRNRRKLIPTLSTDRDVAELPLASNDDEGLIEGFRRLVRSRLGELGLAVLDARLHGQETQSLVGKKDLGSPGKYVIKRVVGEVKALAKEYAQRHGDLGFLRGVQRAMEREEKTVQKRRTTTKARQNG